MKKFKLEVLSPDCPIVLVPLFKRPCARHLQEGSRWHSTCRRPRMTAQCAAPAWGTAPRSPPPSEPAAQGHGGSAQGQAGGDSPSLSSLSAPPPHHAPSSHIPHTMAHEIGCSAAETRPAVEGECGGGENKKEGTVQRVLLQLDEEGEFVAQVFERSAPLRPRLLARSTVCALRLVARSIHSIRLCASLCLCLCLSACVSLD